MNYKELIESAIKEIEDARVKKDEYFNLLGYIINKAKEGGIIDLNDIDKRLKEIRERE